MAELQNKIAVVTGSSRGFGLEIARAFAREGAKVVVSSRSREAVDEAVAGLVETGAQVSGLACDIASLEQVQALYNHTLEHFGGLDIWINNAAISPPYGPTIHIHPDQFAAVLNTNILGTYYGSLIAMRHFLDQKHGKLINILGRGSRGPQPMQNAYASSKAWMINFTRALAEEYKDSGVGVFAINPGMMDTEMLQKVVAVQGFGERVRLLEKIMPVLSQPPEIPARAVVRFASSRTDGRTGVVYNEFRISKALRNLLQITIARLTGRPGRTAHVDVVEIPAAYPRRGGS